MSSGQQQQVEDYTESTVTVAAALDTWTMTVRRLVAAGVIDAIQPRKRGRLYIHKEWRNQIQARSLESRDERESREQSEKLARSQRRTQRRQRLVG
jgi:hypothetical protein